MERISSRSNEKIKLYRHLLSSSKTRYENGLFPAEGVRIVSDALGENADIPAVFVSEKCAAEHRGLVGRLEMGCGNVFEITDELAEYISDTQKTQGLFALCRIPQLPHADGFVKSGGKYIMLCGIQDPGNMGTMLRTADAVGIDGVICCGCCDVFNPKTVRSAMGSILRVPLCICDENSAFSAFSAHGIKTFAAVVGGDAVSLTECGLGGGSAVLIGNEGRGLAEDTAARCDVRMTIKMHGSINSLNAAMAAGIIMWELGKADASHGINE